MVSPLEGWVLLSTVDWWEGWGWACCGGCFWSAIWKMLKMKKKNCKKGDIGFEREKGVWVNVSVVWKCEWSGFIQKKLQWWQVKKIHRHGGKHKRF